MHGLYKRFLLFCAVFVALIFAVVGFWLLLGVTVRVPCWCWRICRSACPAG